MQCHSLWLFASLFGSSAAILYNPSFTGGTGCNPGKGIDSSCSSTPGVARQATNGAGVLCYNTSKNCNVDCPTQDCYPDYATCATGYAGGFIPNVWICGSDNALFTLTSTPSGLPNGAGDYCFLNAADCQKAINNTGQCVVDTSTCSTGQAGPTQYNYISTINKPSVSAGEPSGSGILCYDSVADCEKSNNNPCGSPSPLRCTEDKEYCSTGQAGPLAAATYTCSSVYPPGSLPNGGGQLCYDTYSNCVNGPNACGNDSPCMLDTTTCSTGSAGPTPNNYFCPLDMPVKSLPNGGGQLCYNSVTDCTNGPNACFDGTTCVTNYPACSTGVVGPTPKNTFCSFDQPITASTSPNTPGSLPNAAGGNCYYSQSDCLNGPNACTLQSDCLADYVACSTGQAGPTAAWYFCQKDFAFFALPDGGGELCYGTSAGCFDGPNPCGINSPCTLDIAMCSTGEAGPNPNNWYCEADTPVGLSGVPALPAGSGVLCWDSNTDCISGPNACNAASGCAANNYTTKMCNTGLAAANPVGNNYLCLLDIPTGAAANAAGKWCYDTLGHCHNGTNACNASAPCVATPSNVCATATSGHTYFCAFDYPASSSLNAAGTLCYKAPMECMNGPNPCNSSFLCVADASADASMTGFCKGSTMTWYCPTDAGSPSTTPTPVNPHSSASAFAPLSSFATALAGAALLFSRSPAAL